MSTPEQKARWKAYYEKNKEKKKEYREKNKDKIKAYQKEYKKEYREKNKEKIKEQSKKYYNKNKEQIKEYNKEYREKHKEYYKEYREKNREKIRESDRERYANNKEKKAAYMKAYREKKKKEKLEEKITMAEEEFFQRITDKIINAISDKFKEHAYAPKSESLRTTICRYAVKITDIYNLLDEKPEYWFDPVVIKPLMESDVYEPEMWLYTICGNMDNLEFLKVVVTFILSAEDICKQRALEAECKRCNLEELEKKREQVRELMRMEGLL